MLLKKINLGQHALHNTPISPSTPGTVPLDSLLDNPSNEFALARESFGQRIARLRKARQWTQADLAKRLGVTETSVCYWEQGRSRPRTARLQSLAELLDMPLAALLDHPPADRSGLGDMVARMRAEIACAAGTSPAKVKIIIEI